LCGEKAAQMIQSWGIAFHNKKLRQRYPVFFNTYKHLVNDKGVRFPEEKKMIHLSLQMGKNLKDTKLVGLIV